MISKKAILLINVTGFLLLGAISEGWLYSYDYEDSSPRIRQLEIDNIALREEIRRLRFLQDLSLEFSMSPRIVSLVDRYARDYVNAEKMEWRLIQTPEFLTHIMLSLIHAESRGESTAIGDSGRAVGLTQIWTSTAQQYGDVGPEDLLDPETNIDYAFRHLHYLLKRYRGNLALALYAWNRGQGTVDRLIRHGESPDNGFAPRVYRAALSASQESAGP